ncbi:gamma-aminobutyric acid receptor subunit rho-2 isoform X1 [Pocillopora verrucosa]|uniref:gamma-aminobutyric acid receptor subunit rho-2 isoform X1 n=1 Tax=Pocillopora verrucosa TaxID=203993 RepID=UPI00333FA94C
MSLLQKEYKVELILKETWKDPRLAYGNATWFVRLKNELLKKIWYPDTMIENARKHDVDDKTRTAYLFGDGTIFFSEWIKATLTSHMDFKSYPMDVQTLRVQFAAYSYDDNQVLYEWIKVSLKEHDMTEFYVEKQILRLESTSFITGTHTAAVVEFKIKRRLQHFIVGFYVPCIACTVASWIQFWMDEMAVGDRASLGITSVLTEIFLLEFSNQGMPKVSYMKVAELYLIVSFVFIFLALIESAVVYKVSQWSLLKKNSGKMTEKQAIRDKSHTSQTPTGKEFYKETETPKPETLTSCRSPMMLRYSTLNFEQTVNKSSEHILSEEERYEGTDSPKISTTSAGTEAKESWGHAIDRGARALFPLSYLIFSVMYFGVMFTSDEGSK